MSFALQFADALPLDFIIHPLLDRETSKDFVLSSLALLSKKAGKFGLARFRLHGEHRRIVTITLDSIRMTARKVCFDHTLCGAVGNTADTVRYRTQIYLEIEVVRKAPIEKKRFLIPGAASGNRGRTPEGNP
jgi:hypothetical protein